MERELNEIMEFDHIIRVAEDGTITEPRDVDIYADLNVAPDGTDEFDLSDGWELLKGFTGQYSYNGPVMHPSEFIGGGLERHIRETPGYYVALVVEARCNYEQHTKTYSQFGANLVCSCGGTYCEDEPTLCTEESGCDCFPAGWAVAYRPLETEGN